MKGCLFFVALFVLGAALFGAGLAYDIFGIAMGNDRGERPLLPRVLELSGVIIVFSAIYGAAGWRFSKWWKTRNDPPEES